jgi:uncharacterized protein involved in exopolysaccharide biosynthesis
MATQSTEHDPLGIDNQIDLLEYIGALAYNKYKIGAIALVGSVLVLGITFLMDNMYTSAAVVAINTNEKPGGVAPKDYRTTNAIGLLEHDIIIDATPANEKERLLARMRSMRFSNIFIDENNLIPYIYHKHWDEEQKKWKEDFLPDKGEAIEVFQKNMRAIELDDKTGLLLIYFKTRDAELSAKLANIFVKRYNQYIREISLAENTWKSSCWSSRTPNCKNPYTDCWKPNWLLKRCCMQKKIFHWKKFNQRFLRCSNHRPSG